MFQRLPPASRAVIRLSREFKQLPTSIALEVIQQHIIPLSRGDQFIEGLAISACSDIRNCAIGEVIARHRDGLSQIRGEPDFEFSVQVFARGAHDLILRHCEPHRAKQSPRELGDCFGLGFDTDSILLNHQPSQ